MIENGNMMWHGCIIWMAPGPQGSPANSTSQTYNYYLCSDVYKRTYVIIYFLCRKRWPCIRLLFEMWLKYYYCFKIYFSNFLGQSGRMDIRGLFNIMVIIVIIDASWDIMMNKSTVMGLKVTWRKAFMV